MNTSHTICRVSARAAAAVVLLLFIASSALAQGSIPGSGKTPPDFVPKGWMILNQVQGDLNGDGQADVVLVLQPKAAMKAQGGDADQGDMERLILILLRAPDGGLKLSAQSDKAVMCKECGGVFGDPLSSVKIERGSLVIDHFGGSSEKWGFTHRFRFQNGGWFLIGETTSVQNSLGKAATSVDTNFVTGQTESKQTSCNGKETVQKGKVEPKPLVSLAAFNIEDRPGPSLPSCD